MIKLNNYSLGVEQLTHAHSLLCNQCLSPLTLWVRIPLRLGVLETTLCDTVCQWIAAGQWYSLGIPVSSTNKTDRNNITEILLNTITLYCVLLVFLEKGRVTSHYNGCSIFCCSEKTFKMWFIIDLSGKETISEFDILYRIILEGGETYFLLFALCIYAF